MILLERLFSYNILFFKLIKSTSLWIGDLDFLKNINTIRFFEAYENVFKLRLISQVMKVRFIINRLFLGFAVFLTFVLFLNIRSVSALDLGNSMNDVFDGIKDFFSTIFETLLREYGSGQDIFFVKVLLFILFYVIITTSVRAVPKLGENKMVAAIISLVVSVLAVKWLSEEIIKTILLPYGALGIALATIIPFLIFFYFIHATKMNGLGRRLAWLLFGLSFIALGYSRWSEIPEVGKYFYLGCLVLIILVFLFDKEIHRYFFMHELSLFYRGAKGKAITALQAEYLNIIHVDSPEAEKRRVDIESNLKRLGGDLP